MLQSNPKLLVEQIVGMLRAYQNGRGDDEKKGCLFLLSPGPGKDGNGAPGLGSAVGLALMKEAYGSENITAVTYVLDQLTEKEKEELDITKQSWLKEVGDPRLIDAINEEIESWKKLDYHRPEWNDATRQYAQSLGVIHAAKRVTPFSLDFVKNTFAGSGFRNKKHPADVAHQIISLVASADAGYYNLDVANGVSLITRVLFPGDQLEEHAKIAPLANLNRSTLIAIGRELGVGENILQAPPSNGAKAFRKDDVYQQRFGANRYFNKLFHDYIGAEEWDSQLVGITDQALDNLMNGHSVGEGVNSFGDPRIETGLEKIAQNYAKFHDQEEVISFEL
jgi:hypothetical protein